MSERLCSAFLVLLQTLVVSSNVLNTSYFEFFYGRNYDDLKINYSIYAPSKILRDPHFKNSFPTMIFLDGYRDKVDESGRRIIIDAFLARGDHNVINVNWDEIAGGSYVFDAFPNTIKYGDVLADAILKLTEDGFNFPNLHVVGHSLGSQLASFLGRAIIRKTDGQMKLTRITGLDPAFPLFYPGWLAGHLSEDDANLVDVMHTDGFIYGTPFKTGTVDFWPNGGWYYQPGCPERGALFSIQDLCAHQRSVEFFAESVRKKDEPTFMAQKCESWGDFKRGRCEKEFIHMGMDTANNASGDYYLQTNSSSPYSMGMVGMTYSTASMIDSKAFILMAQVLHLMFLT